MVFKIILVIVAMGISNKLLINKINKSNDRLERIVGVIGIVILDIFLFVYYMDRLNLPTAWKINTNVNTQNWLIIITTCISSVIASAIGGLIAYEIARDQNKQNDKQNKENLRVQNMPLLKYDIKTMGDNNGKVDMEHFISSTCNDEIAEPYDLFIDIKNIGLNNVKRIIVDLESSIVDNTNRILGDNNVISIEKNGTKKLYRYLGLERGKEYQIKLKVYYEDVLQNWYCQIVDINYYATKFNNGSEPIGRVDYKVEEEKIINKEEISM